MLGLSLLVTGSSTLCTLTLASSRKGLCPLGCPRLLSIETLEPWGNWTDKSPRIGDPSFHFTPTCDQLQTPLRHSA